MMRKATFCTKPNQHPPVGANRDGGSISSDQIKTNPNKSRYIPKSLVQHEEYHDRSREAPTGTEYTMVRGGVTNIFPLRMHRCLSRLESDGLAHLCSWQPHGRAFVVHRPREFGDVLGRYFGKMKLCSVQRQLNLYGFKRISAGPDKGAHYHEFFLRDREYLCFRVKRIRLKGKGPRGAANPEQEPNFYKMQPIEHVSDDLQPSSTTIPPVESTQAVGPSPSLTNHFATEQGSSLSNHTTHMSYDCVEWGRSTAPRVEADLGANQRSLFNGRNQCVPQAQAVHQTPPSETVAHPRKEEEHCFFQAHSCDAMILDHHPPAENTTMNACTTTYLMSPIRTVRSTQRKFLKSAEVSLCNAAMRPTPALNSKSAEERIHRTPERKPNEGNMSTIAHQIDSDRRDSRVTFPKKSSSDDSTTRNTGNVQQENEEEQSRENSHADGDRSKTAFRRASSDEQDTAFWGAMEQLMKSTAGRSKASRATPPSVIPREVEDKDIVLEPESYNASSRSFFELEKTDRNSVSEGTSPDLLTMLVRGCSAPNGSHSSLLQQRRKSAMRRTSFSESDVGSYFAAGSPSREASPVPFSSSMNRKSDGRPSLQRHESAPAGSSAWLPLGPQPQSRGHSSFRRSIAIETILSQDEIDANGERQEQHKVFGLHTKEKGDCSRPTFADASSMQADEKSLQRDASNLLPLPLPGSFNSSRNVAA